MEHTVFPIMRSESSHENHDPMRILFLHGLQSTPGGRKPTYLKDHGHMSSIPICPTTTSMPPSASPKPNSTSTSRMSSLAVPEVGQ